MPGRRGMATALLAALLSVLLVAACGSAQPSAGTLARDAVRGLNAAPVKTLQGSFTDGVIPVSVKVAVASNGDASGTGSFDHFPVAYVQGSKSTFVEGTWYWAWERLTDWQSWTGLGSTWVKTNSDWDPATNAFQRASRATGLVALLGADAAHLSPGSPARSDGRQVDQLVDGPVTYDVTATAPHRLVAVRDGSQRVGSTVLGPTRFTIGYGGPPPQAAPAGGQYVDQDDPSTLPAYYSVTNVSQTCQNDACSVSGTVKNQAGAPVGEGAVTFAEYESPSSGTPLASCTVAIPALGHNASTNLTCTIRGPQLTQWFQTGGQVVAGTTISNPPYWT